MTKVERLQKRLEQLSGAGKVWVPPWLAAVGSREEIAEWKAIRRTYRGPDLRDRELEFQREMRKQHPDMPPTIDEIVEEGGRKYAEEHASSKEPATQELEK